MLSAEVTLGVLFIWTAYVLPLYLWRRLPRAHPGTIKKRITTVLIACATVCWLPLFIIGSRRGYGEPPSEVGLERARSILSGDGGPPGP